MWILPSALMLCKHSMLEEFILCGYCRECSANIVCKMSLYYVDTAEKVVQTEYIRSVYIMCILPRINAQESWRHTSGQD
jgi:predicted aldo/keto reductase-like oxidoreductase